MEALKNRRRTVKAGITRLENTVAPYDENNLLKIQEIDLFEARATDLWMATKALLEETGELEEDDDVFATEEAEYGLMETRIHNVRLKLSLMRPVPVAVRPRSETPTSSASSANSRGNDVRLPRLELPTFSGNRQDWLSFHDLFKAAVHNNETLTGAQKLQYLKTSVKGEASNLIQPFKITDDNYEEAWKTLEARFEDKRELLNVTFDRLLAIPVLQQENPTALQKLGDKVRECVHAVDILNVPREQAYELQMIQIVTKKLDAESRLQWERTIKRDELPSIEDFCDFIDHQARVTGAARSTSKLKISPENRKQGAAVHYGSSDSPSSAKASCIVCNENHSIYQCKQFKSMTIEERSKLVRSKHLCFNCLTTGHRVSECKGSDCKICKGRHHSLLHKDDQEKVQKTSEKKTQATEKKPEEVKTAVLFSTTRRRKGLLSTALIKVQDNLGNYHVCRALLDNGSEASFVTTSCANRLGLCRKKIQVPLSGLAGADSGTSREMVDINFSSCYRTQQNFSVDGLLLKNITKDMPTTPVLRKDWKHIRALELADPHFHEIGKIDILLGSDIYYELVLSGKRTGPPGSPTALKTKLGWIVGGKVYNGQSESISSHIVQYDLDSALKKFWELEDLPRQKFLTPEEKACEDHFATTHVRDETGRFVLRLPMKPNVQPLGESRQMAIRRFKAVERRIGKDPKLQEEYTKVIQEYLELEHMELVPSKEIHSPNTYYMPHHVVIDETRQTTKYRVVFDASASSSNGISLNKNLMVGPKLQEDLVSILIRFRRHKIAFTADITKMYRQIRVHPDDVNLQRIIWRNHPSEPIQDYRMLTATFGTASAPYMAVRCIQQLADEEKNNYPEIEEIVRKDFYVDDLMSGSASEEQGILLQQQLLKLLALGGFELRKWYSNSAALVSSIPENLRGTAHSLPIEEDEKIKTLGLQWHPSVDNFSFQVTLSPRTSFTKRSVLSEISKIFDPLGWLSPVIVTAKIFMQKMWKEEHGWDQPLPQQLQEEWTSYRDKLQFLDQVRIPRFISQDQPKQQQLHGFCDSSESAYAAVVFLRSTNSNDDVLVRMVASKSKVAPVKTTTLARLELCGAVLLSRLIHSIQLSLSIKKEDITCWTDSTIVLAWLASPPHRWKTFVANRVSEIHDIVERESWKHVRSKDNPADCASRGVSPDMISSHAIWWNGPEWLSQPKESWPSAEELVPSQPKEERVPVTILQSSEDGTLLHRYSNLMKLLRVTSYCLRAKDRFLKKRLVYSSPSSANLMSSNQVCTRQSSARLAKAKATSIPLAVTSEEIEKSLMFWIKWVQFSVFPEEIQSLNRQKALPVSSRIRRLSPFVDDHGILRVGGRLQHSQLYSDVKHPIILPKKNHLTQLIVSHYHDENLHAGPQALLTAIQQKFWILAGRDVVRQFVRNCVRCCRFQAQVSQQKMGELPAARVTVSSPFQRTGVDYAGPFLLTQRSGRGQKSFKSYVALFICLTTRAIHLELVSDLTTDAFIGALRRFVARRGKPNDIYSDCGTNFVGAKKFLQEDLKVVASDAHNNKVQETLATESISWHLNPPSGPNFGGIWEAGVKSMKFHLKRVIGAAKLTTEEMRTLLCQVEACLNSRPMTELSSDPADFLPLTPGHFLLGRPLTALPDPDLTHLKEGHLSRWQRAQQMFQHFWKRWSTEYLSRLQPRNKWLTPRDNVNIDTLVLLKEDNTSPINWKLGRIISTTLGPDNLVRVVTVKTSTGELQRPVSKLCILPVIN